MISKILFPVNASRLPSLWQAVGCAGLFQNSEHINCILNREIVRYRARKGTRAAALAAKKAKKLEEANKPAPIPKYLQRKVKFSTEFERKRCTDENWFETRPIDNVWNMKLYRGKPFSVSEAVDILRGMHAPALLNDLSALIYVNVELDLKLKKKDRFLDEFNEIVTFPFEFESSRKNKIIVVCKEVEEQNKAIDAGAVYAGSNTLIKQILSGAISSDDYDYVICHPDMLKELNSLRGILKKKFPSANNGLLRLDIEKAVASFMKGIEYKMKRSSIEPDFGWVDICFGRLNMPIEHLEENLKHALNNVEKHKPSGTDHILFIIRTLLWCEKTRERIKIPHWQYLPNYPENGILVEETNSEDQKIAA